MTGIAAIQGVDDTLRDLAAQALTGLTPTVGVTIGPLDRDDDRLRVNWFLYRVSPHLGFRNMEPPRTGWRNERGFPPLALQLHYLLTSHPAALTQDGDEDQFAHRALAAVMRAVHDHGIIASGDPLLSPFATPLLEPLRITMVDLDIDGLNKIWTATTKPLRLGVAYDVSLVVIDTTKVHAAGPPVRTPRVVVRPSMGPRLVAAVPQRISAGTPFLLAVTGITPGTTFTLAREPDDPTGPAAGWPLAVGPAPAGEVEVTLAEPGLAPGERHVDAVAVEEGLPFGRDAIGVTIVPAITAVTGTVTSGGTISLATAHAAADVEVFVSGIAVARADVTFVSPTQVDVDLPSTLTTGPAVITLRAGKQTGPDFAVTVT